MAPFWFAAIEPCVEAPVRSRLALVLALPLAEPFAVVLLDVVPLARPDVVPAVGGPGAGGRRGGRRHGAAGGAVPGPAPPGGRGVLSAQGVGLRSLVAWHAKAAGRGAVASGQLPCLTAAFHMLGPPSFVIVSSPRQTGSRLPASSTRLPGARRGRPRMPALRLVWTCPSQSVSQAVQA